MIQACAGKGRRGMTLIELLIAVSIISLVFGGIMATFELTMKIVSSSKAQSGALSIANETMEYIKSLPYDSVGTVGGIPDGLLKEDSTSTQNGITYQKRILIEYIDDPADGEGAADSNGILADYKLAKVSLTWTVNGITKTTSLISDIVPPSIETTAGGGTLIVNVFDAAVLPVSGAAVHLFNSTGTTTINTTRYTNASGIAEFAGAPANSGYQIDVTKSGYSSDQTYVASSTNPNPTTPPPAVLENQVSTMNFQIDQLSDLAVETLGTPSNGSFSDPFDDASLIATSSAVVVASGTAALAQTGGFYAATGTVFSSVIDPGTLDSWGALSYAAQTPSATAVRVRLYDVVGTSTPSLIPEADLPGNGAGFTPGSVNLSGLDTAKHQAIMLGATLTTGDLSTTSAIDSWSLSYTISQPAIANIPFTLTGGKVIGSTASSAPVYKYKGSYTTDSSGKRAISGLEWDTYAVTIGDPSYDIAEACGNIPYALNPGVSDTLKLTLVPKAAYSLRVFVTDASGNSIPGAHVTLSRTGFSADAYASACGQVFFNSGLVSAVDYSITVTATGFADRTVSDFTISGANATTIMLTAS